MKAEPRRAEWQRSEGMVVFTELSELIFPELLQRVTDGQILGALYDTKNEELGLNPHARTLSQAAAVASLMCMIGPNEDFYPKWREYGRNAERKMADYTYQKRLDGGVYEAANTARFFPINALTAAGQALHKPELGQPYQFDNLQDIADVLWSDWFHDFCHIAAFTRNALWANESNSWTPVGKYSGELLEVRKTDHDRFSFEFTEEQVTRLRHQLGKRNREYITQSERGRSTERAYESTLDNWMEGSTSGCPVANHRPQYTSAGVRQASLAALSKVFDKSPEELAAPRERSGMDIGLDTLAELMGRAYKLQTGQRHKVSVEPEVGSMALANTMTS